MKIKEKVLPYFIIAGGLILRWLYPLNRVFEFDQEQIAHSASQILKGNLTLIGPQTGLAQFFTGPLIYYLGAFIYWLTNLHPIAITYLGLVIYLITGLVLVVTTKKFSQVFKLVFLSLYCLSPYLVQLDRFTWNPNLSFLSGSLILLALINFKSTTGRLSYWVAFFGAFLAYQAHFSGFIIVPIAILLSLFLFRSIKLPLSFISGLLISLLPLCIFDLRHEWLNLKGITNFVFSSELVGSTSFFHRFYKLILVILENIGKLFLGNFPQLSLVFIGLLVLFIWQKLKNPHLNKTQIKIVYVLVFTPLLFVFYRGTSPEYYFLIFLPALVFIISSIFQTLSQKLFPALIFAALLFMFSLGQVVNSNSGSDQILTLNHKINALKIIKDKYNDQPFNLIYDLGLSHQFGWQSLIDYYNLNPDSQSLDTVHLIYPTTSSTISSAKLGKLGIWFDQRQKISLNPYLDELNGILYYYPQSWGVITHLETTYYPQSSDIKVLAFAPTYPLDLSKAIVSFIFSKQDELIYFQTLTASAFEVKVTPWSIVKLNQAMFADRPAFLRSIGQNKRLVIIFPQAFSSSDVTDYLMSIESSIN